ncbi:MAG: YdcH family protein [Limisphaerales bacterium]
MDIHHPFVAEFSEHRETIRTLKLANEKFRVMFEQYHLIDDEICRIEEGIEYATDQQIDELKFKRAKLKDALYTAVQKSEATLVH